MFTGCLVLSNRLWQIFFYPAPSVSLPLRQLKQVPRAAPGSVGGAVGSAGLATLGLCKHHRDWGKHFETGTVGNSKNIFILPKNTFCLSKKKLGELCGTLIFCEKDSTENQSSLGACPCPKTKNTTKGSLQEP